MGTDDHLSFGSEFLTADEPAFAKATAWQAQMDADIGSDVDRSWVHGFLLKPIRSFLVGNQEARMTF
jgi:hypothetical protein